MNCKEQEDTTLAARKAELLAMLNMSASVNGHCAAQDEHPQGLHVESNTQGGHSLNLPNKSKKSKSTNSLQSGQSNGSHINSLKLNTTAENFDRICGKADQLVSVSTNSESVKPDPTDSSAIVSGTDAQYNFDSPLMVLSYEKEFEASEKNFTKGSKWSPDGSCLLVGSEDRKLRLFNLPTPVACGDCQDEKWFTHDAVQHSKPALTVASGEMIWDYAWYPTMNSYAPDSCCFAVTCRDFPIHLYDAWDGNLRCSYYPYDHLDQMVPAHSVIFSLDGSLLVCGFSKSIKIFRTSCPGRCFDAIDAKEQPGIISCMAFNPVMPSILVAGSYLGNLGLYSTDHNRLFCRIDGSPGGFTQVQFSSDGTKLFSGARKSNELLCWDIRNVGKVLWTLKREVNTHQRIQFDLEPKLSRYIVSGTTNGSVLKWDLQDLCTSNNDTPALITPSSSFIAHKDCCNGVSINPHYPILATSSGQRHFPEPQSLSDTDSDDDRPLFTLSGRKVENNVKLWWLGRVYK